jgi:hypothetical protein
MPDRPETAAARSLASTQIRGHTRRVTTKTYSRKEADEILRRALAQESLEGISHEDLVAAAREVGIPGPAIEAAAAQVSEDQIVLDRAELIRKRRRRSFIRHLLLFIVINAGIFAFDWFDGGPWFFQYPLIVWSVILLSVGIAQLAPEHESLVRRAERELEKEQRRAARRQRRGPRSARQAGISLGEGTREFEAAVQDGVSSLLSAAAKAIRGITPPDGDRFRVSDPARPDATPRASEPSGEGARRRRR